MNTDSAEDAAVANAANWLRLIFHSLTCNNPACMLEERCVGGKQLLSHVLCCATPGSCVAGSCTSVRRLLLHWLRCQEPHCRLCAGVWRDLSGFEEAEAYADGVPSQHEATPADASPPPEAPGTPDRHVLPAQMNETISSGMHQAVMFAASARGGDLAADDTVVPVRDDAVPSRSADRAVVQLQEATSYMRYLLHGLMCRYGREAPARVPGHHFWLSALLPTQQQQPGSTAEAVGLGGDEAAGPGAAPPPAGRRLLQHRLSCENPYCALCSGTCELFTRGNALQHELPPPNALRDMDQIVQDLSLALGSVNL